jgi:hypothetical protein
MNTTLINEILLYCFTYLIILSGNTTATVVKLPLQNKAFKKFIISESTNLSSSPYFIRCYDRLCDEYVTLGNKNYILLGLQRPIARTNDINIGYILGESKLSRNLLIADIYYINVSLAMRGCGHGKLLLEAFEAEAKYRSSSVGVFSISIRIVMRSCIRGSHCFWSSVGFVGDINADILIKTIKIL